MIKNVVLGLGFVGMICGGMLLAFGNIFGIVGLMGGFGMLEVTLGGKGQNNIVRWRNGNAVEGR